MLMDTSSGTACHVSQSKGSSVQFNANSWPEAVGKFGESAVALEGVFVGGRELLALNQGWVLQTGQSRGVKTPLEEQMTSF